MGNREEREGMMRGEGGGRDKGNKEWGPVRGVREREKVRGDDLSSNDADCWYTGSHVADLHETAMWM
jgi:hypothetical protein